MIRICLGHNRKLHPHDVICVNADKLYDLLDTKDGEIEQLRSQVATLLPWAELGATVVHSLDGYPDDSADTVVNRTAGLALLDRIDAGDFGEVAP